MNGAKESIVDGEKHATKNLEPLYRTSGSWRRLWNNENLGNLEIALLRVISMHSRADDIWQLDMSTVNSSIPAR